MVYKAYDMLPLGAFKVVAGRMRLFKKDSDAPEAPDYTPMANASAEGARLGKELGDAQLAENRRQYENNMAVSAPVVEPSWG